MELWKNIKTSGHIFDIMLVYTWCYYKMNMKEKNHTNKDHLSKLEFFSFSTKQFRDQWP